MVLGGDGAGKSSALRLLQAMRPDWAYASIDPHALYPIEGLDYMNWALRTPPRHYLDRMGPRVRASFLTHVLSLCYEERVLPELRQDRLVVCDSYHYRVRAKERMLGPTGEPLVAALAGGMRVPDLAVWLEVSPGMAWERLGRKCRTYEAVPECTREGFERMQTGVRDLVLGSYLDGVPVETIDGASPVEEVVRLLIKHIGNIDRAGRAK